jgi:hypothetical protein
MPEDKEKDKKPEQGLPDTLGSKQDYYASLTEAISSYSSRMSELSRSISSLSFPALEAVKDIVSTYSFPKEMLAGISDAVSQIVKCSQLNMSSITDSIKNLTESFSRVISGIQIPSISEERKQELLESHRQWGHMGWTLNPCANIDTLFDSPPEDKKSADRKALKYCTDKNIQELFNTISETKRVKKHDFSEAVFAFENKKYKSCALNLLSLIDAQLIRLQRRSELDKKGRRKVGKRAVEAAKDRASEGYKKAMIFTALFYTNIFECLFTVFEDGQDFKSQPQVVNRNFIDHGMMTKKVTKKDCIQLFLLYYNTMKTLEIIFKMGDRNNG